MVGDPLGTAWVRQDDLARLAAAATSRRFVQLSAVTSGVRDIRDAIAKAREARAYQQRRTVLFIDEIHRFNKAQQDALLPHVEDGTIVLWGATTENPYTSVIAPLLSRVRALRLEPLTRDDLRLIVQRAVTNASRGLGTSGLAFEPEAIKAIVAGAAGDARTALNWTEAAALHATVLGSADVNVDTVRQAVLERGVRYDRAGDDHFDTISAFIKSVRGSDPDAALLWLAKMIQAGEAPSSSPDVWSFWLRKTSATPIRTPCLSQPPPRQPSSASDCPRVVSPWRRRRSILPARPRAMPPAGRSTPPSTRSPRERTWKSHRTCAIRRRGGRTTPAQTT